MSPDLPWHLLLLVSTPQPAGGWQAPIAPPTALSPRPSGCHSHLPFPSLAGAQSISGPGCFHFPNRLCTQPTRVFVWLLSLPRWWSPSQCQVQGEFARPALTASLPLWHLPAFQQPLPRLPGLALAPLTLHRPLLPQELSIFICVFIKVQLACNTTSVPGVEPGDLTFVCLTA